MEKETFEKENMVFREKVVITCNILKKLINHEIIYVIFVKII